VLSSQAATDSKCLSIVVASWNHHRRIYTHTSEYNNITGHALSVRERALARTHAARKTDARSIISCGERRLSFAAEAETIQRLFIGPERARCCVAGNVERKRARDNRASLLRLDERAKSATRDSMIARTVTPLRLREIILETLSPRWLPVRS